MSSMIPNSNECKYNGRKLSNIVCDIKTTSNIHQIMIGHMNDDEYDSLVVESALQDRIKILLETKNDLLEIDLEDVLKFAKKYCQGIYQRVYEEY